MAFHFSLDVVLRLRRGLEHRQELLFQAAQHQAAALGRQIDELDLRLAEAAARRTRQMESGMTAAELHFEALCRRVVLESRESLRQKLIQAQSLRDSLAESLRQARRQRETLETLRDDQRLLYLQQEARVAQREHDDMLLLRRAYLRRS